MPRALRIGSVSLGALPRVAVPFADRTEPAQVASLARRGLDVAELRLDLFDSLEPAHVARQLDAFAGVATLATIRSAAEGGGWKGSEAERLALYRSLLPRVGAVDVEIASEIARDVFAAARAAGRLAIGSFHDFERTPAAPVLDEVVARGRALGADVVKIATAAGSPADVRALARVLLAHEEPGLVVIGMGEQALATRLLFPALGSLLSFAFAGEATAPGQLPFDEMQALFRRLFPAYAAEKARA